MSLPARFVAIKLPHEKILPPPDAVRRFRRTVTGPRQDNEVKILIRY